jgi:hypothetical protein
MKTSKPNRPPSLLGFFFDNQKNKTGTHVMIYKVNALAGSGKTYTAARWAVKFASKTGKKIAIVQPSKILIDQTYNDILEYRMESSTNCRVNYFYGEDTKRLDRGSVKQQIMDHLRDTDDAGEIILMTQAAFLSLPYWHRKGDWIIIVDEIPQVDRYWPFKLPRTHTLLTEHLEVEDFDPLHYRIVPSAKHTLSEYQKNKDNDDVFAMFSELSACILNEHWNVYCRKEQWHRHFDGETEHGKHALSFFGMLEPTVLNGFRDVIIMGAMFDESLLNLYWISKGVDFVEFDAISSGARYFSHNNGELITIKYLFEEDWSKRTRDTHIDGKPVLDWVVDTIKEEIGEGAFVWVGNNDVGDDLFGRNNNRLPGVSNGLNVYQHIDNVIFLSALNRSPEHYAFLKSQGLDPDYVKFATGCQSAYQAIMRGSIRDPKNSNQKTAIVPDLRTAEYLTRYFEGCQIGNLGGEIKKTKKKPGRKAKIDSFSNAEKQIRKRAGKTRKVLKGLMELISAGRDTENTIDKAIKCHNSDRLDGAELFQAVEKEYRKFNLHMFESIYSKKPDFRLRLTNDELIDQLRDCHSYQGRQSKAGNFLISAAVFDPNKSADTNRGIGNIEYVNGIWLDNDGGDLTVEEFRRFFPDLRMVAMNTWSGGNRWRAFFPTQQILTVEAHQIIIRSIERVLNQKGYYDDRTADKMEKWGKKVKRHGFDTSKFVASSLFYAPMPDKHGEGFFIEYPGKEIDPVQWVARSVIHEKDDNVISSIEYECDEAINNIENKIEHREWDGTLENCYFKPTKKIAEYQSHAEHSDARYTGIFGLAMSFISRGKLAGHQLDEWQLTDFITEIDCGYHASQDRKRIPTAVKNALRKAG